MARSYPIRAACNYPRVHHHHHRLLSRIKSIQLPRNGLDLFRSLRYIEYAVRLLVHTWSEIAIG